MPRDVNDRRPYRSPRREQQALETREAILNAALAQFARVGLPGTTIRGVATEAGVAPETVYAAFRSKAGLLAALGERNLSLRGNGESAPLELVREMLATEDLERQLDLWSRIGPMIWERNWAIVDALRVGGGTDDELAAGYRQASGGRMGLLTPLAQAWERRGLLRPDLDVAGAAELLWLYTSPDIYRLLVIERGWPAKRYSAWLRDAAASLLARRD
jgi:AcrR family transcriptional regulator